MSVPTAATMATQSLVHAKEEPFEEILPSTAVYSTSMCIERVYVTLCLPLNSMPAQCIITCMT